MAPARVSHRASYRTLAALTANMLREDVQTYLAAGMDAHVGKPIVIEELQESIDSLLTQQ